MNHSFNTEYAKEYGIEEAILIENFAFWISKNRANNKHLHEIEIVIEEKKVKVKRYFTYNSAEAFQVLFDYMSVHVIRRALKNLYDKGVIIKGHFNSNSYDRTLWYAFKDEDKFLGKKNDISNLQNNEMDFAENKNEFNEKAKSYTDINQIENTDINLESEKPFFENSETLKEKSFDLSSSQLIKFKDILKQINALKKTEYVESSRANILYSTQKRNHAEIDFDKYVMDTLSKWLELHKKQIKCLSIGKTATLQSLLNFDCQLLKQINDDFAAANLKQPLPEKAPNIQKDVISETSKELKLNDMRDSEFERSLGIIRDENGNIIKEGI